MSANVNDPGIYNYSRYGRGAKIELNGEPAQAVITADEEQGYILAYVLDDKGRIVRRGDEAATEERRGVVRIIPGSSLGPDA